MNEEREKITIVFAPEEKSDDLTAAIMALLTAGGYPNLLCLPSDTQLKYLVKIKISPELFQPAKHRYIRTLIISNSETRKFKMLDSPVTPDNDLVAIAAAVMQMISQLCNPSQE